MKIAYQGIEGCYSEAAAIQQYGKDHEFISKSLFEEVFEAVTSGEVDAGIIPVENTIAGSIALNYDLLLNESVFAIAEILLPVEHHLLSRKGNKLENIEKVYSHWAALDQCRSFLLEHKMKSVPEYDTAGAAKLVKEHGSESEAAIASSLAAEMYDLEVVKENIAAHEHNITRFLVIVKPENAPADLKKEKTSVVFKTKHYPGALVNCLQRLSKNDVNLTKLESRPIIGNPWEYVFYADFIGSEDAENVKLTLGEMEASSHFVKVLGSYPLANKEESQKSES